MSSKVCEITATRVVCVLLGVAWLVLLGACQKLSSSTEHPLVRLTTEYGNIDIELYSDAAPKTVANFLAYVDAGLYQSKEVGDASFYRTVRDDNQSQNKIKISVIQGGLLGKGMDLEVDNLPAIAHENTQETGITHGDGVISLARLEPGSGSSEFFICIGDQPSLDYGGQRHPDGQGFAAFGKVVAGMDVVRKIHRATTVASAADALNYTSGQILELPIGIISSQRL